MYNSFVMRDNKWLKNRLLQIWQRYFPDIKAQNEVFVQFGRAARTRLGSIKFDRRFLTTSPSTTLRVKPHTFITITGYFQDPEIPEFVVDGVLAHELVHYAHGFYSPHTQLFRHPHKHGVVDKELTKRGLDDILKLQKRWLKNNWRDYLRKHARMRFL